MSELKESSESVSTAADEEKTDSALNNSGEIQPLPKPKDRSGRDYIRGILNKKMIVLTKDGRVLRGNFHCTDNQLNIILQDCDEFQNVAELGEMDSKKKRHHSLLIIPERYIDNIFIAKG